MGAIAAIYDAVADDEAFARVTGTIAAAAGARSSSIHVFGPGHSLTEMSFNYFTAAMYDRYVALDIHRLDVWHTQGSRPEHANSIVLMDALVPLDSYLRSAFYNENFRWWGDDTAHCAGQLVTFNGGYAAVAVHRGVRQGGFEPADVAPLAPLMPHLARMLALRAQLAGAKRAEALFQAGLDAVADAVWILDAAARPLVMNARARAMVAEGQGLALGRAGLRATHEAGARTLATAIGVACSRSGAQGGAFRLTRPAGPPLRVLVSPLSVGPLTCALVVVNDPARTDGGRVSTLQGLYGLAPAEAEVAAALALSLTPAEIADLRGVSLDTVRTQIRHLLRKTEARGLADLMTLVATAPRRAEG